MRAFGVMVVLACSLVLFSLAPVHAQDVNEAAQLRTQIRLALLSDPRASALSESEIVSLVEALADETESEGVVYDYVPPHPVPSSPLATFVEGLVTPWGQPISAPLLYGVVLFCLAIALLLLKKMFDYYRHPSSI